MNEGRIQQVGSPRDIYEKPQSSFVADFVGSTNFLDGSVLGPDSGESRYRVRTEIGDLTVRALDALRPEEKVLLSVRPEDVDLAEAKPEGINVREAKVDAKVFLGECVDFQVKLGERTLLSRRHPSLRTPVGHPIFVRLDPDKCIALKAA
jgi:iron(III) transport system ATP-binding protein